MSRIVYISRGLLSYVNASFGLCKALAEEGHDVIYLSADRTIGSVVNSQGFEFTHLHEDEELAKRAIALAPPSKKKPGAWWRWMRQRRELRAESLLNKEIEDTLHTLAPDLVVIDVECHYAIIAAAQAGFPLVLSSILFNLYRTGAVPPLNSNLQPAGNISGRFKILVAWWRVRAAAAWLRAKQRISSNALVGQLKPVRYHTTSITDIRALARARGFALGAHTACSHFLRPVVYTRLPLVYMCPRELEFPYGLNDHTAYLGPTVLLTRADTSDRSADHRRWEEFRNQRGPVGTSRPLIYCSLGTYLDADSRFLKRVIGVFEQRSDWDLVLGLGGKSETTEFATHAANVLVLRWAPQVAVLAEADAAITHCGTSTILECIRTETPIVAYPTGFLDQNGNAARVRYHNLGVHGSVQTDTLLQIERNIEVALTDKRIGTAARTVKAQWENQQPHRVLLDFANRHYQLTL